MPPPDHSIQTALTGPLYADLRQLLDQQLTDDLWQPGNLDQLYSYRNPAQSPVRFVAEDEPMSAIQYEQYIYDNAAVPTRNNNWHDLFNALMWCCFPRTKKALNQAHILDYSQAQPKRRSRRRDCLTLIDETGIIVAYSDSTFPELNSQHQWVELFYQAREMWKLTVRPFVLGHGLYEQCLQPYVGLTAKAYYLSVPKGFFQRPIAEQYLMLDRKMATEIAKNAALNTPAALNPFPVLGVPGWHPDQTIDFYQNTRYFRPLRN